MGRDLRGQSLDTQPVLSQPATQPTTSRAVNTYEDIGSTWVPYTQPDLEKIARARQSKESGGSLNDHDLDELQEHNLHIISCECGASTDEGDLVSPTCTATSHHLLTIEN